MSEDRSRHIERFAAENGLGYVQDVPEGIVDAGFFLFSLDTGGVIGVATDMVDGAWRGTPVRAFDFTLPEREAISPLPGVDLFHEHIAAISVAMVEFDADLPYVYVEKKDLLVRVADWLDRVDHLHHDHLEVECGAQDFDREFEVKSEHAGFARTLFDHDLAAAMLATGRGFAYEVRWGRAIVYADGLDVTEWPRLLDAAKALRDHLPSTVLLAHPRSR